MPEGKNHCPKCESDDVLVGSGENPNRCGKCKHKWDKEHAQHAEATSEHVVTFKSPLVLFTINQNFRRNKSSFVRRLDEAFKNNVK